MVRAQLERRDSSGGWQATDIDVIRTPNGILAYPGLGRQAEVVGQLPRRYRVTLEAGNLSAFLSHPAGGAYRKFSSLS